MPQEIPLCRNFRENRECNVSKMRVVEETDEAWVFICGSCEGIQVVSKDGIRDKSKFDAAQKRINEQAELVRRWESRKKIFAVR